jgi:outer membrane immunogenic protein
LAATLDICGVARGLKKRAWSPPNAATNGVIGGVLAGYNWQAGPWVFGLEGDFGWTDAHGTGLVVQPNTYDVNWTGHIRGRFGYAFNTWLLFVAGEFAVADFNFHEGEAPIASGARYNGWTIGGGVEVAILRNLVARLEYLYDDFGSKDYIGVTGDPYRVHFTGQTVRGSRVEIRSFRQATLSALIGCQISPDPASGPL